MTGDSDQRWQTVPLVVVDVEGNGAQPPELVELAVVPIVAGDIGMPRSWLLRPTTPIAWRATQVHGITNADVRMCPMVDEVAVEIRSALGNTVVIGHNIGIDVAVLSRALPGWRPVAVIDTLRLSRQRYPSRASHRLGSLVADLSLDRGLPATLRPHRATYDAVTTARLFVHLIAGGGSSQRLADLVDPPKQDTLF